MGVSFKPLWKTLIDHDLKKGQLKDMAGIASSTISRMSRNEYVSLEVIEKICLALNCQMTDVLEFTKSGPEQDNDDNNPEETR